MAVEVNQLHLKDINLHDNTPLVEVNEAFWDDQFRQKKNTVGYMSSMCFD